MTAFTIEVHRGDIVESVHEVNAVVASAEAMVESWGSPLAPTIARSAIKSVQAIPLLTSGAADAFSLSDAELGLACASHNAEPRHIDAVAAWLDRIGLDADALECGPSRPIGQAAADALIADGQTFQPIHNCCSGKHAGFLSIAQHLGFDPAGYINLDHPVQKLVTEAVEAFTGLDLSDARTGVDGCGIPVFAIPLANLATAMARIADPSTVPGPMADAGRRLASTLPAASFWVSGTDRAEVEIANAAVEPIVAKTGAEGVFMAALPERGVGIALKAVDGAKRAAEVAIGAVLHRLGAIGEPVLQPPILNTLGQPVGRFVVRFG